LDIYTRVLRYVQAETMHAMQWLSSIESFWAEGEAGHLQKNWTGRFLRWPSHKFSWDG